jgi:hypothetical protein
MHSRQLRMLLLFVTLLGACSESNPLEPSKSPVIGADRVALETSGRPQPPGLPFYARLQRGFEPIHSAEWAALVFYRQPLCVPSGFNLLDFFDIPAAFGCPVTVEGFEIFKEPLPAPPIQVKLQGLGAVPVWFVRWSDLQAAISDDVLTVGELQGLDSLVIGTATSFREVLHPAETLVITATGVLADGDQFSLEVTYAGGDTVAAHVRIALH